MILERFRKKLKLRDELRLMPRRDTNTMGIPKCIRRRRNEDSKVSGWFI